MQNPIQRMLTEAEAELSHTLRWTYWEPVIKEAWGEHDKMQRAFDDQTRELENALSFLTPEQLTEFRRKTYPDLHVPKPKVQDCQDCIHHGFEGYALACVKKHRPRFISPKSPMPLPNEWGWKRRCSDFEPIPETPKR
jgi:hypothetical protein